MNDKELNNYLDYLVNWIKEEVINANQKGVVVGISGGIDSAVVAAIAQRAFPNNTTVVWMPCESSDLDESCKNDLIKELKFNNLVEVDLYKSFLTFKNELINSGVELSKLALANSKARLRMTTLYAIAQSNNYLVLGTDNLCEWHIGYFTKFGDGGVDLVPLIHMLKRDVRNAAKILGVPESIINRAPTASLWENQTDESEIGFSYDLIDDYLSNKNVANEVKNRVDYLHKISHHKRNLAKKPLHYKELK
ncbi:NAD(+) synthase [Spiroplasma turonicum]|uniref:NH(3)-dependent NAD(+) synthetase n=1 Tax=Spiroplasma turonicum TaxID=216946 RepID=A0A0K1P6X9_9MOLU|nr:NAD(+) synthase [Spiroplasma turonicum]AKU80053.1 NH(3)-dependent NAD(+) synthetase [Spiroplasma turonicum]ALX71055.1 NH(3)-dependent NAD(+) synthetase [Spiroplasma turonicum]